MAHTPITLAEPARPPVRWQLDSRPPAPAKPLVLDEYQQHVVNHRVGAMLVLAGPGTGKTATLTAAVAGRLRGPNPLTADQVLVLTFARKAAGEIRDRVLAELGGGAVPLVSTFHSLALGLVREFGEAGDDLRLLSAAEQEFAVQEILGALTENELVAGRIGWPKELQPALRTRGMAIGIRNALARARSLGLEPDELLALAQSAAKPEWMAAARLLDDYLDSVDQQLSLDYNELIFQAVRLARTERAQTVLRRRYSAVFVDEYQDTDPLQVALLRALTAPEASLVAVGDPDQSIYAFRGASAAAIKDFRTDFAHLAGEPQVCALRMTRRFGERLRSASAAVISPNSIAGLPADVREAHRNLRCADDAVAGELVVTHYESAEIEAEEVAEAIRARVLSDPAAGYKWSDIAVIVRSGAVSIPILERALLSAGVPVQVTFDDLPLAQEPAVALLLSALQAADRPERLRDPATARSLLTSPLAGLDAVGLRRLGRGLRSAQRRAGESLGWSEQLTADTLADPAASWLLDAAGGAVELAQLEALRSRLFAVNQRLRRGSSVAEALWEIWNGSSWPEQLRRRALSGQAGAAQANHDLDAVMALFEFAGQCDPKQPVTSFLPRIRAVQVPLQERANTPVQNAVSLLTAHRSKGLQWRAVYVCSADEQRWPDIRRRSSIFEPDRLHLDEIGSAPERSEIVAEERRLFYVACSRATEFLLVSTTTANPDSGRTPSRFLEPLLPFVSVADSEVQSAAAHQVAAALEPVGAVRFSPTALVAQMRRIAVDLTQPESLRRAAVTRLARLAKLQDGHGRLAVPAAHPDAWWTTAELTESDHPIDPPGEPLYIRGSSLETLGQCPLSWFMSNRANAREPGNYATNFGSVVHAVAAGIENGQVQPDAVEIEARLRQVWGELRLPAPWSHESSLADALSCVSAFLLWRAGRKRQRAATEVWFEGSWPVTAPDGYQDEVLLRGSVDIVEISDKNSVYIIDLKTSASATTKEKAEVHPQLGLYQAAAMRGLLNDTAPGETSLEGAELVFLRKQLADGKPTVRRQSPLPSGDGPTWVEELVAEGARVVRSEDFQPQISDACKYCAIKSSCPLQSTGRKVLP